MLFQMFKVFLSIGMFTFGGGVAMIPIIEKEVVTNRKWLTDDDFMDVIAMAQASPGVMAANMSIFIGYKLSGFAGALVCLIAAILPSFLIMLAIAAFFAGFRELKFVDSMFKGIRAAVVALLASSVLILSTKSHFKTIQFVFVLIVAVLVMYLKVSPIWLILAGGIGYILYKLLMLAIRR